MTVHVLSQWFNQQPTPVPMTDVEKHEAFSTYAVNVVITQLPWLMPLLKASSATLYVGPSVFFYRLPSGDGQWHEIPEVGRLIPMVPWVEREETPQ